MCKSCLCPECDTPLRAVVVIHTPIHEAWKCNAYVSIAYHYCKVCRYKRNEPFGFELVPGAHIEELLIEGHYAEHRG